MQMNDNATIRGSQVTNLNSAWVLTWKYFSDDTIAEKFVCLYDARMRPDYVMRRVEQIYVDSRLGLSRRVDYVDDREGLSITEKAHFPQAGAYRNEIWCGLHPTLYARKVQNVRVVRDRLGQEHITWDEIDHASERESAAEQRLREAQEQAEARLQK